MHTQRSNQVKDLFVVDELVEIIGRHGHTIRGIVNTNMVEPTIRSTGAGTPNLFNILKIIEFTLFCQLCEKYGFIHKVAADAIRGIGPVDFQDLRDGLASYIAFELQDDGSAQVLWLCDSLEYRDFDDLEDYTEALLIINAGKLVEQINCKISKLKR